MALTTKRIIALTTQSDPQEGDYLAIDNMQNGTHKIPVGRVGVEVDDTLTEAGKAADAKATGDALDEIRSQIEVTGTASGAIATFTDGADMPAKSVVVNIVPKQSGSGTPSPENVRPISGWESVNVYVSPTEDEADGHTTTTSLGRTVYGGTLDVVSGVLTVDRAMVTISNLTKAGSLQTGTYTCCQRYYLSPVANTVGISQKHGAISNMGVEDNAYYGSPRPNDSGSSNVDYAIGTSGSILAVYDTDLTLTDATFADKYGSMQIVYPLAQPQTYTLTGQEISTLLGENNVWADAGDVSVTYVRDLNIAINNLLNSNGTRSLGMMAMSAPTENTAEEPTDEQSDEQTEEPAEDDMR